MKKTLLIILLFCCCTAFAQEGDFCSEAYSDSHLRDMYLRSIEPWLDGIDMMHHSFIGKNSDVQPFADWAKAGGYQVRIYGYGNEQDSSTIDLAMQLFTKWQSLDAYVSYCKGVNEKRKEFGIAKCAGNGVNYLAFTDRGLCSGMLTDSISKLYYNRLLPRFAQADTVTIRFNFNVDPEEAKRLIEWANANGFNAYAQETYVNSSKETMQGVLLTRQLKEPYYGSYAEAFQKIREVEGTVKLLGYRNCPEYWVKIVPKK